VFDWSLNPEGAGFATTSTSYVNMMRVNPAGQARFLYDGETEREIIVAVLAEVSGGIGDVRLTCADTSEVETLAVIATTPTWHFDSIALPVDDPSEPTWLRGGTFSDIEIEARKDTSGTLTVYAVAIGESG
jgi:hypothetical protein